MKRKPISLLLGQMTLFLVLFISVSIVVLLFVGKPLEVNIKDFWGNRVELPLETLILGSVAIILFAHFGAKFLTRPILILDDWTRGLVQSIPSEVLDRPDEIGHLARSMDEMRTGLEKERDLIRIDRDIHRSLNQIRVITLSSEPSLATIKELLLVAIKQANADAAMLVRRDLDGGGFSVLSAHLAARYESAVDASGIILDEEIPETLLVRFRDMFELPFENIDELITTRVNKFLGNSPGASRNLINIPLENKGLYIGSLLLLRSKPGLAPEVLKPLASGIIGSAKYIETSLERDFNWTSIMTSLSKAVDAKSNWTNGHSERVADLATKLGKRLLMQDNELTLLRVSALLHDVGKIAIPELIIDKPGRLSDEEMGIMKQHPDRGAKIVENTPGYEKIRLSILHHHERYDGKGYPQGISGEDIPFHARIIAIADVFDAMTSSRPYRQGLAVEEALRYIESQSWMAFDGNLVKIFIDALKTPGTIRA